MAPREADPLLTQQFSLDAEKENEEELPLSPSNNKMATMVGKTSLLVAVLVVGAVELFGRNKTQHVEKVATGPYQLVQRQVGEAFFDFYDFYKGADSLGSAGYQTYVDRERATKLNLANVTHEHGEHFVYMQSVAGPNKTAFRESVRLEGKQRFDKGLFVLDVAHMPAGCGVWPAFWMTDEANWPNGGEIDIVEGINTQSVAKTALHTSDQCSMYAHVPAWAKTGVWDTSTGLPDTFTGQPNTINRVEADNCWVMAPHQWANQGCVAVSTDNDTIGEPMNARGGGVYALEWDPLAGYIKSWVFPNGQIPDNLQHAMDTSASGDHQITPQPESWPLPYAYFAIGEGSGCSSDHFQQMRLVFNLAFCGTVAGNRFFKDCPELSKKFNVSSDSVLTCNAYIASEPESLKEAYWKIRGVYVYERELEEPKPKNKTDTTAKN